jgi:hypothetical protein
MDDHTGQTKDRRTTGNKRILSPATSSKYEGGGKSGAAGKKGKNNRNSEPPPPIRLNNKRDEV